MYKIMLWFFKQKLLGAFEFKYVLMHDNFNLKYYL